MFDPDKPQYDQSTFIGRFKHFVKLTSPSSLFASNRELKQAQALIATQRSSPHKQFNEKELWKAKYLIDATLHPDTKEKVFLPFRMSSFVPTNLLVTAGLLIPNPTLRQVVFWQWLNQSVNVGINYSNANKSTQMSSQETLMAYGSAVVASVSVAVGLGRIAPAALKMFVPFAAVASAGSLNVFLMRRKELIEGIDVYAPDGQYVGKSQTAGWNAVSQVALSRVATSLPCLTFPPLVLSKLEQLQFFKTNPRMLLAANFSLIALCLITALPCAIALFPQQGRLSVSNLEQELQIKVKHQYYVTYNKGL